MASTRRERLKVFSYLPVGRLSRVDLLLSKTIVMLTKLNPPVGTGPRTSTPYRPFVSASGHSLTHLLTFPLMQNDKCTNTHLFHKIDQHLSPCIISNSLTISIMVRERSGEFETNIVQALKEVVHVDDTRGRRTLMHCDSATNSPVIRYAHSRGNAALANATKLLEIHLINSQGPFV
jgi:hypothetical protein